MTAHTAVSSVGQTTLRMNHGGGRLSRGGGLTWRAGSHAAAGAADAGSRGRGLS